MGLGLLDSTGSLVGSLGLNGRPNLIDKLPIAVYACDAAGGILWFNARAAKLWGCTPAIGDSADRYCGSYKLCVEHQQIAREETSMASVLSTGVPVRELKGKLERPDGSYIWATFHIEPVEEDGVVVGAISCFYETTQPLDTSGFFASARSGMNLETEDRTPSRANLAHPFGKRESRIAATDEHAGIGIAESALTAAQQLAAIVESSDDAIISKDLTGTITSWNRGAERIFGYSAEEVIGKPITIIFPEDRYDEEPEILARVSRGERIDHYETVRQRKDGSLRDISLTVSPIRDPSGQIIGASKIARDITERKLAEIKLRESERQLHDLFEAMPAAIYTTDAQGRITYYNQAAVELAGRTPTVGSDEWCVTWKLYWPDGTPLPHDECPMAVALKEGRPIRNAEAVAERPDGTRVAFIPYPTPLRDHTGKIVGAINMLVDISERKQSETQQRVLLNELNHRVKNNMQMLQSLLTSAARKARSNEARDILADASAKIAAMAAAQRVLYGTRDAMRFSAQEFLSAVCEAAQQILPGNISLVCEAGAEELLNDIAMPLALILNELLTNSAKHGVNERGEAIIRVRLTRDAESFFLSVEDDGPGFDLEAVRGRASGLRLVQGLARQLRGEFQVVRGFATRCILRFS